MFDNFFNALLNGPMIRSLFLPIEKDYILNWLRGLHSVEYDVVDGTKYDLCIIRI